MFEQYRGEHDLTRLTVAALRQRQITVRRCCSGWAKTGYRPSMVTACFPAAQDNCGTTQERMSFSIQVHGTGPALGGAGGQKFGARKPRAGRGSTPKQRHNRRAPPAGVFFRLQ